MTYTDDLTKMWQQQEEIVESLQEHRGFPKTPVDIGTKQGQKFLKDLTHDCQHELFEANQLLKNSKAHRATEINEFDRASYVEELIDAQHFLFEIVIASGISRDEFVKAYLTKGDAVKKRITDGY